METRQGTCKGCLITEADAAAGRPTTRPEQKRGRRRRRRRRALSRQPRLPRTMRTLRRRWRRRRQEVKLSKVNLHKRMKNFNIYDKFAAAFLAASSPCIPFPLFHFLSYCGNFLCCAISSWMCVCVCVRVLCAATWSSSKAKERTRSVKRKRRWMWEGEEGKTEQGMAWVEAKHD